MMFISKRDGHDPEVVTMEPVPEGTGGAPELASSHVRFVGKTGTVQRHALTVISRRPVRKREDRQGLHHKPAGLRRPMRIAAVRSPSRRRGTGCRPGTRRTVRSSARSGDSGPGGEPEPAGRHVARHPAPCSRSLQGRGPA